MSAVLARFNRPCKFTLPRFARASSTRPFGAGWLVAVKITGKLKGWSSWHVVGRTVKPSNPLAQRIAAGCRA